uniref:Transcription factor protein n=1 Tax=Ciona intestinalis TaxID=7719 RepID=Q4H2Z7_CIOIN|nr:transcription factor protein [Ciona intestinalis]BAE06630.1 transcription factor protein [Ciona intestinalis]|eukprot:NP_001071797.1 transcription factor protein [Ciona intestinalis]
MPDHVVHTSNEAYMTSHYPFSSELGDILDESVCRKQDFDWAGSHQSQPITTKVSLPPLSSVFGNKTVYDVTNPSYVTPPWQPVVIQPNRAITSQSHHVTMKRKISKKKNGREKGKTPNVNLAFQELRTLIPTDPVDRRLSKVETLRLAVSYINHLCETLNCDVMVEQPCQSRGNVCTFCISRSRHASTVRL